MVGIHLVESRWPLNTEAIGVPHGGDAILPVARLLGSEGHSAGLKSKC